LLTVCQYKPSLVSSSRGWLRALCIRDCVLPYRIRGRPRGRIISPQAKVNAVIVIPHWHLATGICFIDQWRYYHHACTWAVLVGASNVLLTETKTKTKIKTRLLFSRRRTTRGQDIHSLAFCSCDRDLDPMTLIRTWPGG